MHRHTGALLVAVLLGHLTLISAQVTTRSGVRLLEVLTFGVLSEVQRGAAAVLGGTTGVWHRYVALRGAEDENARLRAELARLGVRMQEQRALALRGERLALILKLQGSLPHATLAADVIAGDASAWFRTVTINRGTSDGLKADMAVISPAGVVGRVVGQPAPHTARVQLLVDRNAGAGAILERTRAGGVAVGAENDTLKVEYVSNLAEVVPGDVVVTSGLDGIYPKGLVIGQVLSVERGAGLYKTVRVRPAVDFSSLEEVLVVTDVSSRRAGAGAGPPREAGQ